MTRQEVITKIIDKYGKYGVTANDLKHSIETGEAQGFSYQTIYTGLRMALGSTYGEQELFTPEEVAEALGCTPEEIKQEQREIQAREQAKANRCNNIISFGQRRAAKNSVRFTSKDSYFKH